MASGFGVDPTKDAAGKVLSGTTARDIRRVFGALYTPGIIMGGEVTTNADMTYDVEPGVAIIETSYGEHVATPFDGVQGLRTSESTSAERTDIIFVVQNFPAGVNNGDSNAIVRVGTSLPPNSQELDRFLIPSGAGNTDSALRIGNIDYSIPYGSGNATLHHHVDRFSGIHNQSMLTVGTQNIYVPTDRRLQFSISSVLYSANAVRFDNSQWCEWMFQPMLDGEVVLEFFTPGLTGSWATYNFTGYVNVTRGEHTVAYRRGKLGNGPGQVATQWGTINGRYFSGTEFNVMDAGAVV